MTDPTKDHDPLNQQPQDEQSATPGDADREYSWTLSQLIEDDDFTMSSGNVYADLGLSDPEKRLAEAKKRVAKEETE